MNNVHNANLLVSFIYSYVFGGGGQNRTGVLPSLFHLYHQYQKYLCQSSSHFEMVSINYRFQFFNVIQWIEYFPIYIDVLIH